MSDRNKVKILKVASHRNGSAGASFYVVTFLHPEPPHQPMVAVVFEADDPLNLRTAVLDVGLLNEGIVEFGANSWGAEHFHDEITAAIAAFEEARRPKFPSLAECRAAGTHMIRCTGDGACKVCFDADECDLALLTTVTKKG